MCGKVISSAPFSPLKHPSHMLSRDSFLSLYVIHVIGEETFRKDNPGFKCFDINCEESSEVFFLQIEIALVTLPLNPPVLHLSGW